MEQQPQTANATFKEARKAYSNGLLDIAFYSLLGLGLILILRHFLTEPLSAAATYLASYIPLYLIAFPVYLLISRRSEKNRPDEHPMKLLQILLAFCACQGLAFCGNIIGVMVNLFLSLLVKASAFSTFLQNGIFGEGSTVFLILAVCCAPFVEEMIFRKVLIDRIRKYGDKTAIIVSGLMFGLFHGNFSQFFYAAFLGMLFAFIYTRTGRIRYTIILHMMVNFWGSAIPLLVMKPDVFYQLRDVMLSGDQTEILSIMPSLLPTFLFGMLNMMIAFGGIVILIVNRKQFHVNPPLLTLEKKQRFSAVCGNFGFFSLLAVCIYEFVTQFLRTVNG